MKKKKDKTESTSSVSSQGTIPGRDEKFYQITISEGDYEALMSLMSFGVRTFAETIKIEAEKGTLKDPVKYDRNLKKFLEIFHKMDDVSNPDLNEERTLH